MEKWLDSNKVAMLTGTAIQDDETPSLAISLYKEYRGFGIGTAMMKEILTLLKL